MPLFDDRALGALERGMDGMWLKQQIASHNIANVETPGYKAKKVEFRDVLYETAQGTERISKPVVEEDGNTQARPKNWSCGRPIPSIRLSQGVSQASCPRCGM